MKYLVCRPFTSLGRFYACGDVITDISQIRLHRLKISEGKLIACNPNDPKFKDTLRKVAHYTGKTEAEYLEIIFPKVEAPDVALPTDNKPSVDTQKPTATPATRHVTTKVNMNK